MITRTSSNKSKKEPGAMQTLYLNSEQTRDILKETNEACMIQFLHYVAIAHQTNPNMEDGLIGFLLGWSKAKVKKNRLSLTKTGWFLRQNIRRKGDSTIIYYVGKEAVTQATGTIYVAKIP